MNRAALDGAWSASGARAARSSSTLLLAPERVELPEASAVLLEAGTRMTQPSAAPFKTSAVLICAPCAASRTEPSKPSVEPLEASVEPLGAGTCMMGVQFAASIEPSKASGVPL